MLFNGTVEEDFIIPDLPAYGDYYNITVYNKETREIAGSEDSKLFFLYKIDSSIELATIPAVTYGDDVVLEIIGHNITTINIVIYNSTNDLILDKNTTERTLIVPGLSSDEYRVTVRNLGNENISEDTFVRLFTVGPQSTEITVSLSDEDIVYGEKNVTATFSLSANGEPLSGVDIAVYLNGEEYDNITVVDGKASVCFENLNAAKYTVISVFDDSQNYKGSLCFDSFNVKKSSSKIIVKDMETRAVNEAIDGRIGEYLNLTLQDANGKPLANKKVQIGLIDTIYNVTTNATGGCKLQINLRYARPYTFAVSFLGDENYEGFFTVVRINVIKQDTKLSVANKKYKLSAKTKILNAKFTNANGKALVGKRISFTVNGKTYSAKTNSNGVATVKVSLNRKGTYKYTAKFTGDNTYSAISKKASLSLV